MASTRSRRPSGRSRTRRDDLVLVRVSGNGKRFERDWLAIYQFEGELCVRIVSFDPDDLADAIEELTRLAMDTTDVETLLANAQLHLQPSAVTAGDSLRLGRLYAPDGAWIDRRLIGTGVNNVTDLENRTRVTDDMTDGYVVRVARELRHNVAATFVNAALVEASGSTSMATLETSYVTVVLGDPATGLVAAIEQFEVDDLVAADARFDEWVAERTWRPVNDAVLLGGLVNVYARAELLDDRAGRLAADFTTTLPDGSTVTADDLAAGVATFGALGLGVAERTVLAVRGNRFALVESVDEADPTVRQLVVHEIDDQARIARLAVVPLTDLPRARSTCSVSGPGRPVSPPTRSACGGVRALLDLDADTVAELTTDDFEGVDHHPLSLLNISRDEFLELQRTPRTPTAPASTLRRASIAPPTMDSSPRTASTHRSRRTAPATSIRSSSDSSVTVRLAAGVVPAGSPRRCHRPLRPTRSRRSPRVAPTTTDRPTGPTGYDRVRLEADGASSSGLPRPSPCAATMSPSTTSMLTTRAST